MRILTSVRSNGLRSKRNSLTCRGSEDRRTVSRQPGLRGSSVPSGGNMGSVNSLLFALDSVQP